MEWFLNECSLHGQYPSDDDIKAATKRFLTLIRAASDGLRHRSERFQLSYARSGEHIGSTITGLPRDLQQAFRDWLFDRANPGPWEPTRLSDPDDPWCCGVQPVGNTSMAEAGARRKVGRTVALLNFERSFLSGGIHADLTVRSDPLVRVPSFEEAADARRWFESLSEVPPYSADARDPPDDRQTCLVDEGRFERTDQFESSRRVYRERTTGNLLYVDNFHFGQGAELEVFSKWRRHLGAADLQGRLRPGTEVPGRTLRR